MAHRIALVTLAVVVGVMAFLYVASNLQISGARPVMPLDDVYIHFQYARVLAEGQPLRYNPDQPPTSGATSLLYPALLAIGYLITDKQLEWWSLAIGAMCWIVSTWLVYGIAARDDGPSTRRVALIVAIAFALSGSLDWAFMSGMETGLIVLATLLTLWYAIREDWRGVVAAGIFAALVRPEGLAIGLLAVLYVALREPSRRTLIRHAPAYALPLIAGIVQPLINLLATGALNASGMQSKSVLFNVPPRGIVEAILTTALRIWSELITGVSPVDGMYFIFILSWLALLALAFGLWRTFRTRHVQVEVMILGWLLALTAAISILETAFWQFKRYQQPMIALLFPLAAWSLSALWRRARPVVILLLVGLLGGTLLTTVNFLQDYRDNVREVASSQIPMAQYTAANVPANAVIGVHDIGVMRYLGNHDTYDVVGLTTPNAARAWRNGPGSVFEQMLRSPWRPDYFAIYADARGLNYLAATDLYKDELASFPSTKPPHNVASATGSGQAVYRADWTYAAFASQPLQPSSLDGVNGMSLVDSLNVADLASEDAHAYRWWEAAQRSGFATEVREMNYIACQPPAANPSCRVLDGGRLITGGEEMTIATTPGQDLIWITRVHPYNAVSLGMFANGKRIATRVIPAVQGQWLEIATLIPGSEITGSRTVLRVEANISDPNAGHYMPYYHWFYQGHYPVAIDAAPSHIEATFGQSVLLVGHTLAYDPAARAVSVALDWQMKPGTANSVGDAKVFIHVLDSSGKIAAQADQRPGQGTLPPANWLPGVLHDSYTVALPTGTAPGMYQIAIGLYDPVAPDQRLPVTGEGIDSARRLFIGTVEVK